MMTKRQMQALDDDALQRAIIHARNVRDAYAEGREPAEVMTELRRLLDVQEDRRLARRAARQRAAGPFSGDAILAAARDAARKGAK